MFAMRRGALPADRRNAHPDVTRNNRRKTRFSVPNDVAAIFADLFRFLPIPDANGGPL
jgi:hypothetical protein